MGNIILKIIVSVIAILYIAIMFKNGCYNARRLENICTEKIKANVLAIRKYHFLTCKYYQVTCEFEYEDKKYSVRKGIFENVIEDELKEIEIHINPNNPQDAYIKSLTERCRSMNIGLVGAILSLLIAIGIIAAIWTI